MNAHELQARLKQMNPQEREKFNRDVGTPGFDDERILDMFVKEEAWEKKICHVLNEPTEAERVGLANIRSAQYAMKGYVLGWIGIGIALVSLAVAIIALMR